MNFRDQIFWRLGSPFGIVVNLWVETLKRYPSKYMLSVSTIGLQEFFSFRSYVGYWKFCHFFALAPTTLETSRISHDSTVS